MPYCVRSPVSNQSVITLLVRIDFTKEGHSRLLKNIKIKFLCLFALWPFYPPSLTKLANILGKVDDLSCIKDLCAIKF